MAEADSSSKGRYEEHEDPNSQLKRDYAEHERLMREREERYRQHERLQNISDTLKYKDKYQRLPYDKQDLYEFKARRGRYADDSQSRDSQGRPRVRLPNQSSVFNSTNYKDPGSFNPFKLYHKDNFTTQEIRARNFSKDYKFALDSFNSFDAFTYHTDMVGFRNVRSYVLSNILETKPGTDILSSGLPDNTDISLQKNFLGNYPGRDTTFPLKLTYKGENVCRFNENRVQSYGDKGLENLKKFFEKNYSTPPDISTFKGQVEKIVLEDMIYEKEEIELKPDEPTPPSSWRFFDVLKSTADIGKRGVEFLMRDVPRENQDAVQTIQQDVETQTSIESNLTQTNLNLQYRDIQTQSSVDTFSQSQQTEKIKTLNQEIQVNNSEILKIQEEKKLLEHKLKNLKSKSLSKGLYLAQLEAEIQQKQDSLDDKNIAIANAHLEIDQINNQLLREQLEKVTLEDEISFKETQLLDSKWEIDSLNEQLTEYSDSTRDYHDQIQKLKQKLGQERADYVKTLHEIKDAKKRLDQEFQEKLNIQKTSFESIINDLKIKSSQDLSSWDLRRQELEKTLKQYKDEASTTPSLKRQISLLEDEVNKLRGNYEALKVYSESKKTEYLQSEKIFNDKVDELQDLIKGYVKQLFTREMEKTKYLDDIEQYKKKLSILNNQLKVQKENFQKNSNDYLLAKSKLDKAYTDIQDRIEVEKSLRERETILLDLIAEKNERIEVKDKEITDYLENLKEVKDQKKKVETEKTNLQTNLTQKTSQYEAKNVESKRYRDELQELKKKKDKLENQLVLNKFKQSQYDRLTLEYNELTKTSNSAIYDRDMLQEELKQREKKIQELKDQLIDPQILKNLQDDNKNLILQIQNLETKFNHSQSETDRFKKERNDLENKLRTLMQNYAKTLNATKRYILKDSSKKVAKMQEEYDKTKKERDELKKEKDKIQRERDRKINSMEFEYKAKLRKLEEKLKKKVKSSDISEVGEFLSRDENDTSLTQEERLKKLKDDKKKFKDLSRNKDIPLEQRLFYNKISNLLDYKIDLANIATGRPVETAKGQKPLKETDKKRPRSKLLKLYLNIGKYGFPFSVIITISYYLYAFLRDASNGAATAANNNARPTPDANINPQKPSHKEISGKVHKNTDVAIRDPKQPQTDWTPYFKERLDEAVDISKKVLSVVSRGASDIPAAIIDGAVRVGIKSLEHLSWWLRWIAENIFSFVVSATMITIYIHSVYGDDIVPLILAFWATFIAILMMLQDYIANYSIWNSKLFPWNWFS